MDGYQVAVHAIGDKANARCSTRSRRCRRPTRATAAGGSSMRRSSIPPTCRASRSLKVDRVDAADARRRATGRWPRRGWGRTGWPAPMPGRRCCRNGVPLAFGSDYPVESPDPWAGWAAAFTRQDANGEPFGGWRPEEKVTREQAWWAFTAGARLCRVRRGQVRPACAGAARRLHHRRPRPVPVEPDRSARDQGRGDLDRRAEDVCAEAVIHRAAAA